MEVLGEKSRVVGHPNLLNSLVNYSVFVNYWRSSILDEDTTGQKTILPLVKVTQAARSIKCDLCKLSKPVVSQATIALTSRVSCPFVSAGYVTDD